MPEVMVFEETFCTLYAGLRLVQFSVDDRGRKGRDFPTDENGVINAIGDMNASSRPEVLGERLPDDLLVEALNAWMVHEEDAGFYQFVTVAEWEDDRMNASRKDLERTAVKYAREFEVKVDSIAFLDAISDALRDAREREDCRRTGLREDGLCASGGSVEGWFDEINHGQSPRLTDLSDLWDFTEEFLPLLHAARNERERRIEGAQ